jgi:hypothetical protein
MKAALRMLFLSPARVSIRRCVGGNRTSAALRDEPGIREACIPGLAAEERRTLIHAELAAAIIYLPD